MQKSCEEQKSCRKQVKLERCKIIPRTDTTQTNWRSFLICIRAHAEFQVTRSPSAPRWPQKRQQFTCNGFLDEVHSNGWGVPAEASIFKESLPKVDILKIYVFNFTIFQVLQFSANNWYVLMILFDSRKFRLEDLFEKSDMKIETWEREIPMENLHKYRRILAQCWQI